MIIHGQWFQAVSSGLTVVILVWIGRSVAKLRVKINHHQEEHEFLMKTVTDNTKEIKAIMRRLRMRAD